MKSVLLLFILTTGIFVSSSLQNGANEEGKLKELTRAAIQEATAKYDDIMKQATINGAQSRRQTREAIKSTKLTQKIGKTSTIFRSAFEQLTGSHHISSDLARKYLQEELPNECQFPQIKCDPNEKYRTVDGTCNNIDNAYWGATRSPSRRLLPPEYNDGKDEPRGGKNGTSLPPSRKVSLAVHIGKDDSFQLNVTHMAAQFGQFLDHDISLTPSASESCCKGASSQDCWTIDVAQDDSHYSNHSVTCLDFVRSTGACFPSSSANTHREQFNAITAFIDASMVYGSDNETFHYLRTGYQNGQLAENSNHSGFLPWESEVKPNGSPSNVIAGDIRANEMPGLTVMHSLFLREHNRIAKELSMLRDDWDDERIFQETRRIIAAELQQITYGEFLPVILGVQAMKKYNLELPVDHTTFTKYSQSVDASIYNYFATAAYRFGHTLVNGLIKLYFENNIVGNYSVRENYLVSTQIIENTHTEASGYDLILNGLIRQESQAYDGIIHQDMTNHLFKTVDFIGSDLAARNVQRGRDHGIPSYNKFREFCSLSDLPKTWAEEPPIEISKESWEKLEKANYSSPHDVDLYTGGLSEIPAPGALSGPTFVCLQAIQFEKLWKGDRFFFTHEDVSGSFTPEQLAALRGRTLGDIICQNSAIKEAPRNVFYTQSQLNPMVLCNQTDRALNIKLFANLPAEESNSSATNLIQYFALPISLVCLLATTVGPIFNQFQ